MSTTYVQKTSTIQKADNSKAVSILDSSSQSEALQRKADMANNAAQREEATRSNNTGMPDNLKSGIESLSGFSMDDVRVHYNSSKPATVQALAYTQGTDIHVAPGQEKHLPHEAWHVAQQMAGRVSPTTNINGMPVNDNAGLEHEADVMGEKAVQRKDLKRDEKTNDVNYLIPVNDAIQLMVRNGGRGYTMGDGYTGDDYPLLADFEGAIINGTISPPLSEGVHNLNINGNTIQYHGQLEKKGKQRQRQIVVTLDHDIGSGTNQRAIYIINKDNVVSYSHIEDKRHRGHG